MCLLKQNIEGLGMNLDTETLSIVTMSRTIEMIL